MKIFAKEGPQIVERETKKTTGGGESKPETTTTTVSVKREGATTTAKAASETAEALNLLRALKEGKSLEDLGAMGGDSELMAVLAATGEDFAGNFESEDDEMED